MTPGRSSLSVSLTAVLAASACSSTRSPAAPEAAGSPNAARRIVVLGDSLAVSPSRSYNFASELQTRLDSTHPGWTIANHGVSGDTTGGGLRRIDQALTADTRILVLELGANDGFRNIAISTVEQNLSTMIERAQAKGIAVLLCGMETPPLNGWSYSIDFHKMYPRLAGRYGVPLVPFLLAGVALNPELNGADEIHPNAAGARMIAETVWPFLDTLVQKTVKT